MIDEPTKSYIDECRKTWPIDEKTTDAEIYEWVKDSFGYQIYYLGDAVKEFIGVFIAELKKDFGLTDS